MRDPQQVLNALCEHSKDSGYRYERLYRILFNEEMFFIFERENYKNQTGSPIYRKTKNSATDFSIAEQYTISVEYDLRSTSIGRSQRIGGRFPSAFDDDVLDTQVRKFYVKGKSCFIQYFGYSFQDRTQ